MYGKAQDIGSSFRVCGDVEDESQLLCAERAMLEHRAGAVLLASGRFLGKGLRAERTGVHESIFDLPVFQPPRREDWHQRDLFHRKGHLINRSGLEIDDRFRPVGENRRPVYPNLYAAGAILAHQDWIRQKCGSGLAIASAYGAIKACQESPDERSRT